MASFINQGTDIVFLAKDFCLAMKTKAPFICTAPWSHIFINNEGHFYHCCIAEAFSQPISHQGKPLHVSNVSSLLEVLEADDSVKIREEMIQGKTPSACQKCAQDESCKNVSYRYSFNSKYHSHYESIVSSPDDANISISSIDMRPGNLCNLKCRMCYPLSSKLWLDEWPLLFQDSANEREVVKAKAINWHQDPAVWKKIEEAIQDVSLFHFAGGEPLIIPEVELFLKYCIERGLAERMDLSFNTNLTILKEEMLELWGHFKSVKLMISIDGTSEVNHYIRYPSRWSHIQENLEKLKLHSEKIHFFRCSIVTTVQLLNIYNIKDLVKKIIELNNPVIHQGVKFNFLDSPSCYSACALPQREKESLIEELQEFAFELFEKELIGYALELKALIRFLKGQNLEHELPEAKRRIDILDKSRHQRYDLVIPELKKILDSL